MAKKQIVLTYYSILDNDRHWALGIEDDILMSGYYRPAESRDIKDSIVTFFEKLEARLSEEFVVSSILVTLHALGLDYDPEEDMDLKDWGVGLVCMQTTVDKIQNIINNCVVGNQVCIREAAERILML